MIPLLKRLTIVTKDLKVERIGFDGEFSWAQIPYINTIEHEYNQGKPVRIIILKARQLGMSTITEGVLFNWCFIHPGTESLVIAHESRASEGLYRKTQMFWQTWPFRPLFHTSNLSLRRIAWEETRSAIQIATAKNIQSGRSLTIHALHASECAFWENAEQLMTGLSQTIPEKHGSLVVIESTANGVGNWYHDSWEAAVDGDSDYIPLFFPWYKHPEYRVVNSVLQLTDLNAEEKDYYRLGVDLPHLEWRRWMIPNKMQNSEENFKQEYPATPEEAFLTTGRNVFPLDKLADCYDFNPGAKGRLFKNGSQVIFKPDPAGPLTLFKYPAKDKNYGQYFVAGDPTHTTSGDNACIQVINRRTFEQVAVWHGKIDPIAFADELLKVAIYFNEATITTEIEGPGYGTISRLKTLGYDKIWQHRWADKAQGKVGTSLGWSTNFNRKHQAIGQLLYLIVDNSILLHDAITYRQMRNYVTKNEGEMGNNRGVERYDDAVMAMAICVTCSITEGPVSVIDDKRSTEGGIMIPRTIEQDLVNWS